MGPSPLVTGVDPPPGLVAEGPPPGSDCSGPDMGPPPAPPPGWIGFVIGVPPAGVVMVSPPPSGWIGFVIGVPHGFAGYVPSEVPEGEPIMVPLALGGIAALGTLAENG
jgi:hypothetical protein